MRSFRPLFQRAALGSLVSVVLLSASMGAAHAVQIVPSVGIGQTTDGGGNKAMFAVALRNGLLPRTQAELQVGYRSETRQFLGQNVDFRTTPVTLSLWASPVPMLYAGGGVGAYVQSVKYGGNVYPASTDTQFGAHLGGGMHFSMAPMVGLDLQGRYVYLEDQKTPSGSYNPSFWTFSAGLAIGL